MKRGKVLMFAWMNKEALERTIAQQRMIYWSRSRNALWEKGATSGHYQTLKSMQFDCDGDAVLCKVSQEGAACHTHRDHCFYFQLDETSQRVTVTSSAPQQ